MRRTAEIVIGAAALLLGLLLQDRANDPSAAAIPRAVEDYYVVPVRAHLLRSDSPVAGTKLKRADIERIFRKAGAVWHAAGIHLWLESVVEEKPAGSHPAGETALDMSALMALRPAGRRAAGMFHVYYLGEMPINGVFIDEDGIFVQERARLLPVGGGIDEPLPRVTAHELGHALGLRHRQARTNLMASGTTGILLNDEEIHAARRTAESLRWALRPEALLPDSASAEALPDLSRLNALLEIPGESPLKDRARQLLGIRTPLLTPRDRDSSGR